jgi:hypothetical protein
MPEMYLRNRLNRQPRQGIGIHRITQPRRVASAADAAAGRPGRFGNSLALQQMTVEGHSELVGRVVVGLSQIEPTKPPAPAPMKALAQPPSPVNDRPARPVSQALRKTSGSSRPKARFLPAMSLGRKRWPSCSKTMDWSGLPRSYSLWHTNCSH